MNSLQAAAEARFGSTVFVRGNAEAVLCRNPEKSNPLPPPPCPPQPAAPRATPVPIPVSDVSLPAAAWRVGAFEVLNEDSGELLFSKLKLGVRPTSPADKRRLGDAKSKRCAQRHTAPKNDGSRTADEERQDAVALDVASPQRVVPAVESRSEAKRLLFGCSC